jgi:hypothetical protein
MASHGGCPASILYPTIKLWDKWMKRFELAKFLSMPGTFASAIL